MFVLTFKKAAKGMHEDVGGLQGWLVVLAAFFTQFIICGVTYSIGIFHVLLRDTFCHPHFDTSWVASWLLYSTALSSICLRVVTARLGCRVSVILGGVIASAGLGLTMAVREMYQMYFTLGIMTGVGFGLACTPSIVAVETYFHNGRAQAMGVTMGGIGAGIITVPLVLQVLVDHFAWRGMFLILAGVALNLCVCGALLRPIHGHTQMSPLLPMFSTTALQNPLFHAMCWSNLFWSFGSTIIYVYLPSWSMSTGTNFNDACFLVACIGMAAFISRLIYSFMGNDSTFDPIMQMVCSVGIGVVITGICPEMFERYTGQLAYTLMFGFYSGYWTSFMSQACRELIGPECIAIGNGYLSSMVGLGALGAGPIAAWVLQEDAERYTYVFYMAGACLLVSSTTMTFFKIAKFPVITIPSRSESKMAAKLDKQVLMDARNDIIMKNLMVTSQLEKS